MIIFGAPFRYYQGYGIIKNVGEILAPMGNRFLVVSDAFVFDLLGETVDTAFAKAGLTSVRGQFSGESSDREIGKIVDLYQTERCDAIVGLGGGKAADTAKAASIRMKAPVAIVPTIAASDAPVSHIAMIYKDDHSKERVDHMAYSPWCIVMDTEVILHSPLRLLISGIGDAAATKFEADACRAAGAPNFLKGKAPKTAAALGDLCWQIIRDKSLQAVDDMKNRRHSEDFEEVVEAVTLLSGLGFENGGLAAGHAMSSGLTMVPSTLKSTHGETVAFGLLVQLVLEGRPDEFIAEIAGFLKAVGLPTTLARLGVQPGEEPLITAMVNKVCTPPNIIFNMPVEITPDILEQAIYRADGFGQ